MIMRFRFCLLVSVVLLTISSRAASAGGPEAQKFAGGEAFFNDTFYSSAEREFAEFVQTFPSSPRVPDAILLQARSRLEQSNYAGAIQLLSTNQNVVGARKDEFLFWMGETRLREGNHAEAGKLFAQIIHEFAASPRRVEAAVKQAIAGAKQGQWQTVVDLLGAAEGVFQAEAKTNAGSDFVLQGYFLLTEAHLKKANYAAAEAILEPLGKRSLNPTNAWGWQYFVCRVQSASGKAQLALDNTTNLLALASKAAVPALQAESVAFRAELLESMGRVAEAVEAYTNNFAARIPVERQRQAVLNVARLLVKQNKSTEAAQVLEKFLAQNTQTPAADVAWMQLGELRLRQFVEWLGTRASEEGGTNAAAATNRLGEAIAAFQTVATQHGRSAILGVNFLNLGWCYWFANKIPESRDAFQKALAYLPPGSERARTHFKLGDAQFREKDYPGAITNYEAAVREAATVPGETNLFEPGYYQIVRAGLAVGNLAAASNALSRIIAEYPKSFYAERSVLLFGQRIGRDGHPANAREVFQQFITKMPETALRPELELAIARTHEQENGWLKAVETYDGWLNSFTNHAARPEAMFYRAQAMFHAGNGTNAYSSFTNFVAQYPTNKLTPMAQWWIADFRYNSGAYVAAENDYQIIAANWPGTEMRYEALMMAGRAAFLRQGWNDAINYFATLAKDTNCPTHLHFRALYAYGDTLMAQVSTNKTEDYQNASQYFETICQQYSTNYLAVLACGEKAKCLLQLATSGAGLTNAAEAFKAVLTNSVYADGTAKSIARVGLGVVLEKQGAVVTGSEQTALRGEALDQYLRVLYGLDLKQADGDEYWTKVAGNEAIRLASEMQEWEKVIRICERMAEKLPQIAPAFNELRRKAMENLATAKSSVGKIDR
jgi:TolA-binding protein